MKKFIAIALILLIPILFGISWVYAEAGPETTTEPASTEITTEPTPPETNAPDPVESERTTGTLKISRAKAAEKQAFWYTVEQHQADGYYLELVKVAILPGESSVTITGLTLETGYRITEHVMTSDGEGYYEHVELIRLTQEAPDREVVFSGALRNIGWFADFASSTEKKEG